MLNVTSYMDPFHGNGAIDLPGPFEARREAELLVIRRRRAVDAAAPTRTDQRGKDAALAGPRVASPKGVLGKETQDRQSLAPLGGRHERRGNPVRMGQCQTDRGIRSASGVRDSGLSSRAGPSVHARRTHGRAAADLLAVTFAVHTGIMGNAGLARRATWPPW